MFNPWRVLRALTHVNLVWRVMPTRLGQTNGVDRIWLHPHQSQAQRRSTLAHELAHIEMSHTRGCNPADERAAREWAARKLITMPALLDVLRWAPDLHTVAEELWVDEPTVLDRLEFLTTDERAQIIALHATIEKGA